MKTISVLGCTHCSRRFFGKRHSKKDPGKKQHWVLKQTTELTRRRRRRKAVITIWACPACKPKVGSKPTKAVAISWVVIQRPHKSTTPAGTMSAGIFFQIM